MPVEPSATDWPVSPLTQPVEVWLMNIDQFIHLLQTVVCRCHDVDAFQWDVVMVPVSPTVHPDREGYHNNTHDTVTQNTSTGWSRKKGNSLRRCLSDGTEFGYRDNWWTMKWKWFVRRNHVQINFPKYILEFWGYTNLFGVEVLGLKLVNLFSRIG